MAESVSCRELGSVNAIEYENICLFYGKSLNLPFILSKVKAYQI